MRPREDYSSFDELFFAEGEKGWDGLRDAARSMPEAFDDAVADEIASRLAAAPRLVFGALLDVAGRAPERAARLIERYRELLKTHPGPGLAAAGYNLFEYHRLLDERWIADARSLYDADPEGAWGIATSAASYEPRLLRDEDVDWFEERWEDDPEAYFRVMLQFAVNSAARRENLVARALRRFDLRPAAAVKAATGVSREKSLLTKPIFSAVLRSLESNPESAWEYFSGVSYETAELFDDAALDALDARIATGAPSYFALLHRLAERDAARAPALLARYVRLLPAHPEAGVYQASYVAANDPGLLTQGLVDAVAAHFSADAYKAYDVLSYALRKRPELLHARHIEIAAANTALATNWAFGFFRKLLEERPDAAPVCTLALFECLAQEPPNRAQTRVEELQSIVTIAQASHVKTELERALREPPSIGSRRARALMAILFREKLRARQHVLFEALRLAATGVTWTNRNRTPLWDFFLLLLDESPDKAITTTAAERFLEGAFQLTYLMDRGADHDAFREKFALEEPGPAAWPDAVGFLAEDAHLDRLHRVVVELARRCGARMKLSSLDEYAERVPRAEAELAALARELAAAEGERRGRLEKRRAALEGRLALWRDPAPDARARAELERERRGLRKSALDALRAELARISLEAVEGERLGLYAAKIEAALGRKVDVSSVDPAILPAFLFFPAVSGFPNNRKWLARLIEDRLLGKPHDWLWTEPESVKWQERVRAGQPGVALERWRRSFSKEYDYAPADAAKEKKRRMKTDLAQTRKLLEGLGATGLKDESFEELSRAYAALSAPRDAAPEKKDGAPEAPAFDPRVLDEIRMNLERVKIVAETPESDYAGRIKLEVETDPFQVLFMGEYGFASCLSLRGSNVWSAVSNAIDVDKAIVWAREAGTNVVGRRLIALTPEGLVSYRTYANRHGLALDVLFQDFLEAYAAHCGTRVAHAASPGPLLSDRWYDDGAL
jgi:hypothetical protein